MFVRYIQRALSYSTNIVAPKIMRRGKNVCLFRLEKSNYRNVLVEMERYFINVSSSFFNKKCDFIKKKPK